MQVFLTRSHLAIVFEYAAGGNLAHYIETFQSSKTGRGISEVIFPSMMTRKKYSLIRIRALHQICRREVSQFCISNTLYGRLRSPRATRDALCYRTSSCRIAALFFQCPSKKACMRRNALGGFSSRSSWLWTTATKWA